MSQKPVNLRPMPAGTPYVPKVTIRVSDNRSKKVSEFSVTVPTEGHIKDMFPIVKKLRRVLEAHGFFPPPDPTPHTERVGEADSD